MLSIINQLPKELCCRLQLNAYCDALKVDYGHLDYKEARGEAPDAKLDQLKGDLGLGGHFHGRIQ